VKKKNGSSSGALDSVYHIERLDRDRGKSQLAQVAPIVINIKQENRHTIYSHAVNLDQDSITATKLR
jgi:hypothetical protein